ncbi:hypothetical protein E3O42_07995 [Cryobacterium adonitolivorans]|uniref:Transcriptional regulator, AbiEi antitoxin, Type IV TA system n=1 Tax=Cryobacterium adonitolivorans TaxID=1259189 RepID=A0A4R8W523_9MICO|nr:hypothetical protein [Cryobacterium adonitolivorans]TFC02686.1 hypothetical protein E3O42_07995 [Cryobacterium adonitolivorans]
MDPNASALPQFQLTRDQLGHDARAMRRDHAHGGTERLRRGIYVPRTSWSSADADARYLLRIQAAVMSRQARPVMSHLSAARVWGLPMDAGLQKHFPLPKGAVLPTVTLDEVLDRVRQLGTARGTRRARQSVGFSDARSGSVGESLSRTGIFLAGMPMPDLQVVYPAPFGEDRVDFRWKRRFQAKRMPLLGEFDGELKYTRGEFMGGHTIDKVVWAEKRREDRLRAPGRAMVRWLWADALRPERLRAVLLNAGLRPAT